MRHHLTNARGALTHAYAQVADDETALEAR
jgi:hypothetical protein